MSGRSLVFLLLGLLVLPINWAVYRLPTHWKGIQSLKERQAALADKQKALAGAGGASQALRRQVEDARAEREEQRAALRQLEAKMARPEQLGELTVQLAALAAENGLVVETQEPLQRAVAPRQGVDPVSGAPLAPAPRPTAQAGRKPAAALDPHVELAAALASPPFERPVQRWVVSGDFVSLRRFVTQLRQLSWRVVVLEVELSRAERPRTIDPPLRIRLEVVL